MNKKRVVVVSMLSLLLLFSGTVHSEDNGYKSRIVGVQLFQNQAKIMRTVSVELKKGTNVVVIGDLPKLLYDWSARASLTNEKEVKILSMEVEKKALIRKRQKRILEIEKKLESLRDRDLELVDELKNIESQETFLKSIMEFTNQTVSKELATRIPQVSVWDNTMNFVSTKRRLLLKKRRDIEKQREMLGKNIQKWEFELSQIAGYSYFTNYQSLNKAILQNRSSMNVQQFADITKQYAKRRDLLVKPSGKVDIEKRFVMNIYAGSNRQVDIAVSYVIPNTFWRMKYDLRADNKNESLDMVVYADVYQKTEEDWNAIRLSLSTGSPVNAIRPPVMSPWYLTVRSTRDDSGAFGRERISERDEYRKAVPQKKEKAEEQQLVPDITEKGPYFDITLPIKQTIISSNRYQKKLIKEYTLDNNSLEFYYEIIPALVQNGFIKVKAKNSSEIPWLPGNAQIFLNGEYMGKVDIPYTPIGKDENVVLGIESRIMGKKELVKKYEDTGGLLGGKRRILYSYKITVGNQMPERKEITIWDALPVSRNKKINITVENLSDAFDMSGEFKKSTDYARGFRKWKFSLDPNTEKTINFDIVISFDKDVEISGLR